jgi:uncharacterized protein (TIGR03435 family)
MRGAWTLLFAAACYAQDPGERPHFEVASIKPDSPGGVSTGDFRFLPGGRLSAQKVLLRFFIQNAYDVRPFQILGAPEWINSVGYDIEAKADGDPVPSEMKRMMQTLLEDRFKLRTHRDLKEMPVYALTMAKSGKLPTPGAGSCEAPDVDAPPRPPASDLVPCGRAMVAIGRTGGVRLQGGMISMRELARILSNLLGRAVIDRTEFGDLFDLHLIFALDDAIDGMSHPPEPPRENQTPSIFVAVEGQLGLKLVATRGPVEVLVIDHVERPSGN